MEDVPPDIHLPHDEIGGEESSSAFRDSRWITRGWTLQELIAPKRVYFYERYWSFIGEKASLIQILHSITLIDPKVLGEPLMRRHCCIAERMSWASRRETTRPEDEAYSLMGIFSVHMPLLYGEGGKRAFLRLQQEIWKESTDHSLFTWTAMSRLHFEEPSETTNSDLAYVDWGGGLLAYSTREFAHCNKVRTRYLNGKIDREPYEMTNMGLRISLPRSN